MKSSPLKSAFNRGELTPLLGGHINIDQRPDGYYSSLNVIPLKQGPITRRGGSVFVSEVKDSSKFTRIEEFEFSTLQAYQIEMGENYFRFYKDRSVITETPVVVTGITKANPGVVTAAAHGFANGNHVYLNSVVGMTQVNGRRFTVANVTANTFELSGVNTTSYSTYTSGGTAARVYTVTSTYTEAEIPDLNFTQSADVLYIAHPAHMTAALTRTGHAAWTLTTMTFKDGPYQVVQQKSNGLIDTTITVTPSANTGVGITLTASAALFTLVTDVNRIMRIKRDGAQWGVVQITAVASTTSATATVLNDMAGVGASTNWRLGRYSATTGYPSVIGFVQNRFTVAAPTAYPQAIDFGATSEYDAVSATFRPTVLVDGTVTDAEGFSRTLPSGSVNAIQWINDDARGLLVGTTKNEWLITSGTTNGNLTPNNAYQRKISSIGSNNVAPLSVNTSTIFIQSYGRKMYELGYLFQIDSFDATDLTLLSEHITKPGITDLAYQQEPLNTMWSVRSDGYLIGTTYLPQQKVVGWHKHLLGGTAAKVKSVSHAPTPDGTQDDLWMIVSRTIGGATKQYVEYMSSYYTEDIAQAQAVCVDSSLSYSGASTTTISGAWHLEGQTVKLLVNGASHPDVTVTNGGFSLNRAATDVVMGLGNTWHVETLPIEAGAADGTAQGKTKRINNITVRYLNTLGVVYSNSNYSEGEVEDNFDYGLQMGTATPLYSGDRFYPIDAGYDTLGQIRLGHDGVFPATILMIAPQLTTEDR